jgi:hypothetical protein
VREDQVVELPVRLGLDVVGVVMREQNRRYVDPVTADAVE